MKLNQIITSLLETDMYKFSMGQTIFHQFTDYKTTWTFKCRNELFLDLVQDVSCAFASIDNRSNYIDALIGYIERNYADPKLNIDALADHVGLSASHIQNIFKAATGSSISAYLRRLRLNKATEFLAQTDVPISEIAERTGFGNSNYFYTVFKRHYAVTPSEYRANRLNRADTKEAYNNEIN